MKSKLIITLMVLAVMEVFCGCATVKQSITVRKNVTDNLPFAGEGNWYKGNLHGHSTLSDGKRTPQEVIARYRQQGWGFIALTDHRLYNHCRGYSTTDFLVIPGIEMNVFNDKQKRHNHMVAIRQEMSAKNYADKEKFTAPKWKGKQTVQQLIDQLNAHDNFVIFCHPVWSGQELADFVDYKGLLGLEIYNHGCQLENNSGNADIYWDSLLRRKQKVYGFATDDSHHKIEDTCGGWICVKSTGLAESAIVDSILQGRFYSSTGPAFLDYGIKDGKAFVKTSPVREIHFVTYEPWGKSFYSESDKSLSEAEYKLKGTETYVRVEIVDYQGKKAWTNAIFL